MLSQFYQSCKKCKKIVVFHWFMNIYWFLGAGVETTKWQFSVWICVRIFCSIQHWWVPGLL